MDSAYAMGKSYDTQRDTNMKGGIYAKKDGKKERKKRFFRKWIKEERVTSAMPLYSGKTREEVRELLCAGLYRRMGISFCIGIALMIAALAAETKKDTGEERMLLRPKAGEEAQQVKIMLETEEGVQIGELQLGAYQYSEEEIEGLHALARERLEEVLKGQNQDYSHIVGDLYFPKELQGISDALYWYSDCPELVSGNGKVNNEDLREETTVTITARIYYGEEFRVYSKLLTVQPRVYSAAEAAYRNGMKLLQGQEELERQKESFLLPETVSGMKVELFKESSAPLPMLCAFLLLLLLPASFYAYFQEIEKKKRTRSEEAGKAYQEFVMRISLLMAAGLSARQAWKRLTTEYTEKYGVEGHVLAKELFVTESELSNGKSEVLAYEAFGERMKALSYQRLSSMLIQYVTKGVQGIRQPNIS